jgi:hypothetical protein
MSITRNMNDRGISDAYVGIELLGIVLLALLLGPRGQCSLFLLLLLVLLALLLAALELALGDLLAGDRVGVLIFRALAGWGSGCGCGLLIGHIRFGGTARVVWAR